MTPERRISLWSGPRNVSTALMYAFRERPDTRVVDEPLYAHYLRESRADHPGVPEVLAAQDEDARRVISRVILGPCDRPVLFFKNMAHHLEGITDWTFLDELDNVLLTRHPREMLPSLALRLHTPVLRDTAYTMQVLLLDHLEARSRPPLVVEAMHLLLDPEAVLRALCHRLALPWDREMLEWEEGPKPEDGVWAPHWYQNVHASTGFLPYRPKTDPFPEHLVPLLGECLPLYERLAEHAITG
jgi:hypothetical protein